MDVGVFWRLVEEPVSSRSRQEGAGISARWVGQATCGDGRDMRRQSGCRQVRSTVSDCTWKINERKENRKEIGTNRDQEPDINRKTLIPGQRLLDSRWCVSLTPDQLTANDRAGF